MKRTLFLLFIAPMLAFAQTQQGYVKTKGRLASNGTVIAGTRLPGATVTIRGGNAAVSGNKGTFTLSISGDNYYLQNVEKNGYVLTDPDVLAKQYAYSKNPLVLVLETPSLLADDKLAAQKKIHRILQRQLQEKEDEIELLKEQKKLSEEESRKQLQELYRQQETNDKLINEMAERYSMIDFDEVNEFNRRISSLILEGKLTEADSLLNTKGNINSRAAVLHQHQKANAQEEQELKKKQKKLEKSKAMTQKELKELAQDCYSRFEIFKMQHQNDSAAHYIELRAELDTMNIEWQNEAGKFIEEYLSKYDDALQFYYTAQIRSLSMYDNNEYSEKNALCNYNIGFALYKKGIYNDAIQYFGRSLEILHSLFGEKHIGIANCYNGIGLVNLQLGNYTATLNNLENSLRIRQEMLDENHPDIALSYNDMGVTYFNMGNYEKAEEFHNEALAIRKKVYGDIHPMVALCYNNIGAVKHSQKDYDKAIEYFNKSVNIYQTIYGENHPEVASCYNNLGAVYEKKENYEKALNYHEQSLKIRLKYFGESHPTIGFNYSNIGNVYYYKKDYERAMSYQQEALRIRLNVFGKDNMETAASYNNIGTIYKAMGKKEKAVENYKQALESLRANLPDNHPYISVIENNIKSLKKFE